jgi:hypothetical protein
MCLKIARCTVARIQGYEVITREVGAATNGTKYAADESNFETTQ